eukprot:CAMPEP_0184990694 /NCGR_PEP_ID=MMETSP1098-20130426/33595_1 /TAXON_ID=89044 /ORGANISM="Spumella elongata, Strain CCAP 955/1" /LENGTH=38 /DNA_ID= /DNA_START= /DNA_END= /DNA_ORIENTATION=
MKSSCQPTQADASTHLISVLQIHSEGQDQGQGPFPALQ